VGAFEAVALAMVEATLKYHPCWLEILTCAHYLGEGHCLVGSLTGAVASQKVTEAYEGHLRPIGNRS
jgi:hypothetical protein